MAFRRENMGVVGYCNGFTMWYYISTTDTQAVISASGYFNDFAKYLRQPDLIIFTDSLGRTGFKRINVLTPTLVTVSPPL